MKHFTLKPYPPAFFFFQFLFEEGILLHCPTGLEPAILLLPLASVCNERGAAPWPRLSIFLHLNKTFQLHSKMYRGGGGSNAYVTRHASGGQRAAFASCSPFSLCGFQGSNASHQTWQQSPWAFSLSPCPFLFWDWVSLNGPGWPWACNYPALIS